MSFLVALVTCCAQRRCVARCTLCTIRPESADRPCAGPCLTERPALRSPGERLRDYALSHHNRQRPGQQHVSRAPEAAGQLAGDTKRLLHVHATVKSQLIPSWGESVAGETAGTSIISRLDSISMGR